MKKILNVLKKIVKWYLIGDVLMWAFVGTKELWREDIEDSGLDGFGKLVKEAFYSWKNGEYMVEFS